MFAKINCDCGIAFPVMENKKLDIYIGQALICPNCKLIHTIVYQDNKRIHFVTKQEDIINRSERVH